MKPKRLAITLLGCAVLAGALLLPGESSGQAGTDETQVQQVLAELTAQQTLVAENQAKIDEKVALIAEEVRVARIFVGRAGGKAK
ncbi:MAG: hypothetical protein ABMA13_05795 [Chthoniobacteraceae bacterium]